MNGNRPQNNIGGRRELESRPGITARRIAMESFASALRGGRNAYDEIRERARGEKISDRDMSLIYELASGCVRRMLTLDAIIDAFLDRPVEIYPLNPALRNILRIGVYQAVFCEGIPGRAAVNETVELAKATGRGRSTGMINGILRSILREAKFGESVSARSSKVVITRPGRTAEFVRSILPDPDEEPIKYLAAQHSYPEWLTRRWIDRFGAERAANLMAAGNEQPSIFLRPFAPKSDIDGLIAMLAGEGIEATPSPSGLTVVLPRDANVAGLKALRDGFCLVQDDTAASVVPFLDPKPNSRALDLCAAPGGKACQLAEMVGGKGKVIAVDSSAERIKVLSENLRRLGLGNVGVVEADGRNLPDLGEPFDFVLVDAPCSNTAVLRRRIEARWRVSESSVEELSVLQRDLALSAARRLKPGGAMVYSTCALEPEENRGVVDWLLARGREGDAPALELEEERLILPQSGGHDGGYIARMIRATGDQ